jgi:Anti-sigma regulatory factor (Ser/Thr protein kinase)
VIEHGLGGSMQVDIVTGGTKVGMRMIFKDKGPGIIDLQLAMTDGYSSQKGMGLGLTGSKRLMDDFEIKSEPSAGTIVTVIKWK